MIFIATTVVVISEVFKYSVVLESAEAPLASITSYLNKHSDGTTATDKEAYKANGIFMGQDVEIGLCEISGPFGDNLPSWFHFDFIKGMYGCLSASNEICSRYQFAKVSSTMSKFKVVFVHTKVDSLQIWSLQ
ncbi:hypothetical protein FB192DRAFT_1338965 [Mucor lusitanicus]|uniref:Uncharacterized protein n=1 Tax=Mucor circinelloides f. lusitanicus TaxID=29924 RepID=A0A8H4BTB4_MUCCL|nr:hypothetical protein FB192DRAFT_1338965 [Mucor lusitanicus]